MGEILKKLNATIKMIETIDLCSSSKHTQAINQKKIHSSYNNLLELRKEIERRL